jgi:hypothetical protein
MDASADFETKLQLQSAWDALCQQGTIAETMTAPMLKQISVQPAAASLSLLVIENQGLEKIF